MEYDYNYYNYDQNKEEFQDDDIFDEGPKNQKTPKEKKKVPKVVKAICFGMAFGLAASVTFQAGNAISGKIFGKSKENAVKQTGTVSTAQLTQTSSTVTSDVSAIVDKVMPSVVSITNLSIKEVENYFGFGFGFSMPQQQESTSVGSGIIISQNEEELLIVSNNHVVEGATTLTVSFVNEESVEAYIKGTDPTKDLAIVSIPLDTIPQETLDAISVASLGNSNNVKVGEPSIAIGNALGYGQSVTTGIISALNRDLEMEGFDSKLIQTDAAINPGNSGGALLNANGEVIGINTVKVNDNAVEGMGYAIPISDASEAITTLMNRQTRTKVADAERGYIGIEGVDVTQDSAEMYSMPVGVYITNVVKDGAAEKAGLSKGTIITELDGITIDSMVTLKEQLGYYAAGETVKLQVQILADNGEYQEKEVEITLQKN